MTIYTPSASHSLFFVGLVKVRKSPCLPNHRRLLCSTVEVMSPESSLLIDDWVLQDIGAPVAGNTCDLMMLMLLSGMERSDNQWESLHYSLD